MLLPLLSHRLSCRAAAHRVLPGLAFFSEGEALCAAVELDRCLNAR